MNYIEMGGRTGIVILTSRYVCFSTDAVCFPVAKPDVLREPFGNLGVVAVNAWSPDGTLNLHIFTVYAVLEATNPFNHDPRTRLRLNLGYSVFLGVCNPKP